MRLSAAVPCAAVAAALGLAACGGGDESRSERVSAAAREVGSVVQALERALERRDYERVCERLFSAAIREQAGGRDCPERLRESARDLERPRIRVQGISIRGDRAVARVVTKAAGQKPAQDTIVLVKEGGRYRVGALGAED